MTYENVEHKQKTSEMFLFGILSYAPYPYLNKFQILVLWPDCLPIFREIYLDLILRCSLFLAHECIFSWPRHTSEKEWPPVLLYITVRGHEGRISFGGPTVCLTLPSGSARR